ncbi:hypothetical protein MTR67_000490 [Solanum verrucosum]|uniref:Uncharacterized protein n=1 Tax=Solanum verrucosum TaxID=315347 RepID=A0AAF0PMI6_SOLVR|nr:hypothetical protein MTR67_000467 [Solanum verrucosum]WMV07105.1 hypothetical protein MTR67_000490 [Solanum verrucosum]
MSLAPPLNLSIGHWLMPFLKPCGLPIFSLSCALQCISCLPFIVTIL